MNPWSAVVVLFTGMILRVINLTTGGLWLDEIWSMQTSDSGNSVSAIIAACKLDTHPPLFDLMLHAWLTLFGDCDLSGRTFGLVWGLSGMIATWYIAWKITGKRSIAFVALALISFSYFHIYYSNEVRFYGFLYLLSLVAVANLYFYLKTGVWRHIVVFTFVMVLALYTHYYAVFLMASIGVSVLLLFAMQKISARVFWGTVISGITAVLIFSPWIPVMLSGSESASWMLAPNWYDFFNYFYLYTGKNPGEFIFLLAFFFLSVRFYWMNPVLFTLLFGMVLFGFLFPFIASHLVTPLLHERYTMIYFPAIILLVAVGFTGLLERYSKIAAGILLGVWISVGINLVFINDYFIEPQKEPWKAIAEDLQRENSVLQAPVYTEMKFWLDYYLVQNQQNPAKLPGEEDPKNLFWIMHSPYDLKPDSVLSEEDHIVEKEIKYENDFRLVLLRK